MSTPESSTQGARVPSVEELFVALTRAGVVPVADGERLRVRAPRGALTAELRAAMELHRHTLWKLLKVRFRGPEECVEAQGNGSSMRPCRRMGVCARSIEGGPCFIPATCCICGDGLTPGRRYCCPACSDERRTMVTDDQGDR